MLFKDSEHLELALVRNAINYFAF